MHDGRDTFKLFGNQERAFLDLVLPVAVYAIYFFHASYRFYDFPLAGAISSQFDRNILLQKFIPSPRLPKAWRITLLCWLYESALPAAVIISAGGAHFPAKIIH